MRSMVQLVMFGAQLGIHAYVNCLKWKCCDLDVFLYMANFIFIWFIVSFCDFNVNSNWYLSMALIWSNCWSLLDLSPRFFRIPSRIWSKGFMAHSRPNKRNAKIAPQIRIRKAVKQFGNSIGFPLMSRHIWGFGAYLLVMASQLPFSIFSLM